MVKSKSKAKTGRPLAKIDPRVVEGMASVGASNLEIAEFVGVGEETIRRRFGGILTKSRAGARIKLRQSQLRIAHGIPASTRTTIAPDGSKIIERTEGFPPNPTMLIWLGKQMLNQQDKVAITDPDGGAFRVIVEEDMRGPKGGQG
jgi:hypothetical protein